jgi:hypothetical protein
MSKALTAPGRSLTVLDRDDEARTVAMVAQWAEPHRRDFDQQFSTEWIEEQLREALRGGLLDVVGVIEAAEQKGDELADKALRAVGAELMRRPEGARAKTICSATPRTRRSGASEATPSRAIGGATFCRAQWSRS